MQRAAERFSNWYEAHMEKFIPKYAFFSLISCFLFNCIIYWATQILLSDEYHYDFTMAFDRAIPFQPQWVYIYILSYPFWIVNYAITSRSISKERWYRFVTADMLSRVACAVMFVLLPTTNIRPELNGTGLTYFLMGIIYRADLPYNLFPSIHCLASWMSYIGIRKNERVPKWYRIFSLMFALLIFASTQFTKQHYIVDVIGGVALAQFCFFMMQKTSWYMKVMAFFDAVNLKVFGEQVNEN